MLLVASLAMLQVKVTVMVITRGGPLLARYSPGDCLEACFWRVFMLVDDGTAVWPTLKNGDPIEQALVLAVDEDSIVGLQVHANKEQLHVQHHATPREIAAQHEVKAAGDPSYVWKVIKLDASRVYSMQSLRPASLLGTTLRTDTVSTRYCCLVIWSMMKKRPELVTQTLASSGECCCSFPANVGMVGYSFGLRPQIFYGSRFCGL